MTRNFVFSIAMVLFFSAQTFASQRRVEAPRVDRSETEAQIYLEHSDLKFLAQVSIQGDSIELQRVLELPSVSSADLTAWLKKHSPHLRAAEDARSDAERITRLNHLFHLAQHPIPPTTDGDPGRDGI